MVLCARDAHHAAVALGQGLGGCQSVFYRIGAFYPFGLGAVACQAQNFRGIASHQCGLALQQVCQHAVAVGAGTRAYGVEHAGFVRLVCGV